ncbi:MAG TPA: hypothetical protein V6D03_03465 [Candidatus Caenarcaniphilales bacterium]
MENHNHDQTMPQLLDLDMSDEEYLHQTAQGRDPVQERICLKNLIRAGVAPEAAYQVLPLMKKPDRSCEEEALVRKVWQRVRSQ